MVLAIEQMEHMIHLLQAQVLQLTSRVSTLDEALLAERRHNEQIATQLRAQVDASEGVSGRNLHACARRQPFRCRPRAQFARLLQRWASEWMRSSS